MRNERYIAAIDQGTTGTRCVIFNKKGDVCGFAYKKHRQIFLDNGFIEHDPLEILKNTRIVLRQAVKNAKIEKKDVESIGITNQRETFVIWNKYTGIPIHNAIVWQDTRTASLIDKLQKDGFSDEIRKRTGLLLSTYFSASKVKWLIDNSPKLKSLIKSQEALFGNIDSWLIWNLTGGKHHYTDYTNASRTMLFNLRKMEWDNDLLHLFKIDQSILPEVLPSLNKTGFGSLIDKGFEGTIINSDLGDQQAALFGERCFSQGETKITYGTGSFVLQNTGKRIILRDGLITTCAYGFGQQDCKYAIEGSVQIFGEIFDWLKNMGLLKSFNELDSILKKNLRNKVYFVPAFSGLFAPYWDNSATGMIIGITENTKKEDIVNAAVYGLVLQINDIIKRMDKIKGYLHVDGGVSVNSEIMQLQSNILGKKICRSNIKESSALGAALASGITSGFWDFDEIKNFHTENKIFYPSSSSQINETIYYWEKAVKRAMKWKTLNRIKDRKNNEAKR
ncbi:MAG: glycerol kinase [Candidatus Parvarchaeum sp.]